MKPSSTPALRIASLALAACALTACTSGAQPAAPAAPAAAAPALKRTIVAQQEISGGREAVVASVEVAAGGFAAWHTHPGEEISYITEGETILKVAGQPDRVVKAGQAFIIPAGVVHAAKNHTDKVTKLVGVYTIEKGKPLATPAAAPAGQ